MSARDVLFNLCRQSEAFKRMARETAEVLHRARHPWEKEALREWLDAESQVFSILWSHLSHDNSTKEEFASEMMIPLRWAAVWEDLRSLLLSVQEVHQEVARRAYGSYEQQGCRPGNELADWLRAEDDVFYEQIYWFLECARSDEKRRFDLDVMSWGGS
jgi:hypothetical protein